MSNGLRALDWSAAYLDDNAVIEIGLGTRLRAWCAVHARSIGTLGLLLPLVALLHGWNMYRSPGLKVTDDEGTYVSQAWAVDTWHQLATYTYWYDHPPIGWIQIGAYAWLTDAWSRAPFSVAVGREFMLVVDVCACALIYVLSRRLGLARWAAAATLVLFAASPLSLQYHRMVWLDNIGVLWLIASLVLAASRRSSLSAALGSAACLAVAVLSKETVLLLAPVVLYVLWQHSAPVTRRYRIVAFATLGTTLILLYPLYAVVKNELLAGPGHVSLLWAVRWQLTARASNGSILDHGTLAASYFEGWLREDPWLLGAGLALGVVNVVVPASSIRYLRPIALGLLGQWLLMLRHGYLPEAYVVAMLPFAAILIGATAHHVGRLTIPPIRAGRRHLLIVAVPLMIFALALVPVWGRGDEAELTEGSAVQARQAVAWMRAHVPADKHIVVDNNVWLDLVRAGYDPRAPHWSVIWAYKMGADPAVKVAPTVRDVDYLMYATWAAEAIKPMKNVYDHSRIVASFGSGANQITIWKVIK